MGDVASDPICTSVLMDCEDDDEEDDLDQEVRVYRTISDEGEWLVDICITIFAAQDAENIRSDEECSQQVRSWGRKPKSILYVRVRLVQSILVASSLVDNVCDKVKNGEENMKTSSNGKSSFLGVKGDQVCSKVSRNTK